MALLPIFITRSLIVIMLLLCLSSVLRLAYGAYVLWHDRPACSRYTSGMTKLLRLWTSSDDSDEISRALEKCVLSQRCMRWMLLMRIAMPALTVRIVRQIMHDKVLPLLWREMTAANDFHLRSMYHVNEAILLSVCLAFNSLPCLLTSRGVVVGYCCCMLAVSMSEPWVREFCEVRSGSDAFYPVSRSVAIYTRAFASIVLASTPHVLPVQLLQGASNVVVRTILTGVVDTTQCITEAALATFIAACTGVFEWTEVAQVRAELQAKVSRNSEEMAEKMFKGLCEVFVHLDCNMMITQPSPQLASFLLRAPSAQAMQGIWFPSLFQDDADRVAFEALVSRPSGALAHSMNVRLVDSMGTVLQARLFHTNGLNLQDEDIHTIGILGPQQDEGPLGPLQTLMANEEANQQARDPLPATIGRTQEDRYADLGASSESSGTSSDTLPLDTAAPPGEVAVWVGAFDSELPIRRHTPAFAFFCGPAPPVGMSMRDLVGRRAKESLEGSVQMFVNEEKNRAQGCEVRMLPRSPMSNMKGYDARVYFKMEHSDLGADMNKDGDEDIVKLTFREIRVVRPSRHHTPRSKPRARCRARDQMKVSL